jgi:hypothetical protein
MIGEYLKALKLPAFAAEYRGLVRQATEAGWDYEDFLRHRQAASEGGAFPLPEIVLVGPSSESTSSRHLDE